MSLRQFAIPIDPEVLETLDQPVSPEALLTASTLTRWGVHLDIDDGKLIVVGSGGVLDGLLRGQLPGLVGHRGDLYRLTSQLQRAASSRTLT